MKKQESEKQVEDYLRLRIEQREGRAYKFTSPGNAGVPDRIAILPGGRIHFIELKGSNGVLTQLQKKKLRELKTVGCSAMVIGSREDVDELMSCLGFPGNLQKFTERQDERYGV